MYVSLTNRTPDDIVWALNAVLQRDIRWAWVRNPLEEAVRRLGTPESINLEPGRENALVFLWPDVSLRIALFQDRYLAFEGKILVPLRDMLYDAAEENPVPVFRGTDRDHLDSWINRLHPNRRIAWLVSAKPELYSLEREETVAALHTLAPSFARVVLPLPQQLAEVLPSDHPSVPTSWTIRQRSVEINFPGISDNQPGSVVQVYARPLGREWCIFAEITLRTETKTYRADSAKSLCEQIANSAQNSREDNDHTP